MRRWAFLGIGTMIALYLLMGFIGPTHTSSGDEIGSGNGAVQVDGVDLNRGKTEKKRPSLGGTKPERTKPPKVKTEKTPKPARKGGKPYRRARRGGKRPSLLGPRTPAPTKAAPPVKATPVVTGRQPVTPVPPVKTRGPVETKEPVTPTDTAMTIAELKAEIDRLKVRINALTAGGIGNDEAKAKAILDLIAVQNRVSKEADKKEAELAFKQAQDFYRSGQYLKALQKAKRAYDLDPNNESYASFVRHLSEQLSSSTPDSADRQLLEREVMLKQMLIEIRLNIDKAKRLYSEAMSLRGTDAVEKLNIALTQLGQAQFTANSISARLRPEGIEKTTNDLIKLVKDLLRQKVIEQKEMQRERADLMAEDMASIEHEYLTKRINDLINRAYLSIHNEQYRQAELLLEKVIKLDPANREAKYLLKLVQRKGDTADGKRIDDRMLLEKRRAMLLTEEFMIPYRDIITYPDNWDEIDRIRSAAAHVSDEEIPEWKKLITAKMQRKISVSFVDTPLAEVVENLRKFIGVSIIIHTESLESVAETITLDLKDMTFKTALEWVLQMVGLNWTLYNEAIFIASPEHIQGDLVMHIYDCRDLVGAITNFAGPNMTIGELEDTMIEDVEEPDPEQILEELMEMIKTKIEPNSWDDAAGGTIDAREGKLVVTNVMKVHKKIEELLDSFRKAQKLQVNINARFIRVVDDFVEDIGVEWKGLDRDSVPDLNGIDPAFPAGFSSDPTKRAGGWDAYDLRGVILDNTLNNTTSGLRDATFLQVGEGLNLQYALLGNFQAEIILNAVQKSRKGITLLAPRLTVFNTQRAYLMVATEEAYIADYEGLIATQAAILDPVVKTFMTGMILDVRPIISSDRKYITIEMRPTRAELLLLRDYHIISLWGLDYPIYAPVIQVQKVRTTICLPDNGILLLGGQIDSRNWRVSSGVPFLSKLPIIGRLFSHDIETRERAQLLIFVNARIIMLEEIEQKIRAR